MSDFRQAPHSFLNGIFATGSDADKELISKHLRDDVVFDVAFPVNRLEGCDAVVEGFYTPLKDAFSHVRRRDEIFIGGPNRRAPGGHWIASVTHYVGNFEKPLFGIQPSHHLVFLRSGEFYRVEPDGRISEAKIIFDLLDLMRQAGLFPLPQMLGTEMLFPGPATHDGVLPKGQANGEKTLDLCEAMLADLKAFDPENFTSKGQTGDDGYWHDDMLWYGPGGIGSNYRWSGFEKDHRAAFLTAFPDRVGGNHYCRIGDGNFAAVSGWPSMTMTHQGDYLGVKATGKPLTLRVMDFYRCAGGKIMENWVLLDYLELFHQMGVDLIERSQTAGKP
ncbi:ester cyclase [Roseibium sediminicola]|uniref:Ester cyclase n=1 Tax=Roseibium sediminicola TaxID=2933272 RepID=A0ABT0GQD8_9HYPH|nr:ester cyclase [Roseibium sp. CAU 1639]MCK7611068.1 ester cyclase [Roseibium sp. CAU 1639]